MIQIYHNPKCAKSRECLALLENLGEEYEILKYLEETPDENELKGIIKKLGIKAIDLVRTKEQLWKDKFEGRKLTAAPGH